MIGPKGKFMLQPDDDRTHIFISSGTGNAPFVSMIRQLLDRWHGRGRSSSSTACRTPPELGYREQRRGAGRESGEYPVTFVPTVSRPRGTRPTPAGWAGPVVSR